MGTIRSKLITALAAAVVLIVAGGAEGQYSWSQASAAYAYRYPTFQSGNRNYGHTRKYLYLSRKSWRQPRYYYNIYYPKRFHAVRPFTYVVVPERGFVPMIGPRQRNVPPVYGYRDGVYGYRPYDAAPMYKVYFRAQYRAMAKREGW